MKPLGWLVLIIFCSIIGYVIWRLTAGKARKRTQKRIQAIRQRKSASGPKKAVDMQLRRKTEEQKGLVYWLMKPLPDFKRLGDRLERGGKTITPKQFIFRRIMGFLIFFFVVSVILKKSLLLGAVAGFVLGVWIPLKLLGRSINKRSKAFIILFPDAIDLIVRGLRSGLPVSESLVLVSSEMAEPLGSVFTNIANTMKLGVPLEKALQETAIKLDLTEFNFFTTCIILQRETGGNLAEILSNLSEVLRGRFIMRMKIKAMSSEARASAMIIGALPFVVILAVSCLNPGYMSPLIDDHRGNICAFVACGMMSFGLWVMYRMTQFEI